MPKVLMEKIEKIEQINSTTFKMTILSEYLAKNSKAGQFVNVRCAEGTAPLLRRPISICFSDRKKSTIDLLFQVKGEGTRLLSRRKPGELLDILGPLGNGFILDKENDKVVVIGGGIGIFPLLFVLSESEAKEKSAYLGFRNAEAVILKDEFLRFSDTLCISTDDGSVGNSGVITQKFEQDIQQSRPRIIYACGPLPMLKRVAEIAALYEVPCQVSLEERMGCGIGACLVCACKIKHGKSWEYSHACTDGPVFWSEDVCFEDS